MNIEIKDSFVNRRVDLVIVKRPLGGGESTIHTVTGGSLKRLRSEIAKIYEKAKQKPHRRLEQPEKSDEFFQQWKADNENNLIDLGRR